MRFSKAVHLGRCVNSLASKHMSHHSRTTGKEFVPSPVVETVHGHIQGIEKRTDEGKRFYAYLGIPYGKPPVGNLRFKPPQPNERWSGVLQATKDGPASMQISHRDHMVVGSEDCLHLNVYTPQVSNRTTKPNRSILVWIHGGAFLTGSCSSHRFSPELFMNEDVVIVSINYRLGILGFVSTGDEALPGNNGLKDQVLALKWIRDNISAFGGNPENVTLFGESSGAACAHLHVFSSLSKGLFHRIIAQSGSALNHWALDVRGALKGRLLGEYMNIPKQYSNRDLVNALCERDAEEITSQQRKFMVQSNDLVVAPVVETFENEWTFLPRRPRDLAKIDEFRKIPLLTGFNSEEAAYVVADHVENTDLLSVINKEWRTKLSRILRMDAKYSEEILNFYFKGRPVTRETIKNLVHMASDRMFIYPIVRSARLQATGNGAPVFLYQFTHQVQHSFLSALNQKYPDIKYGVCHADELQYLFANYVESNFGLQIEYTDQEKHMRQTMVKMWANFAKTGNPTPEGSENILGIRWIPLNAIDDGHISFINIRTPIEKGRPEDFPSQRMKFWDKLHRDDENVADMFFGNK